MEQTIYICKLTRSIFVMQALLSMTLCCSTGVAEGASEGTFSERFQPYDTNYALMQGTKDDERAVEVQYSFKYLFYNCEFWEAESLVGCTSNNKAKLFFSYTGEFDFYMGTRESGPVINRVSNPALHFRVDDTDENPIIDWVDFGVEHRSNGQVVDVNEVDNDPASPTFGQFLTQIEYQAGNHKYFDTLSRSANYINLAMGVETDATRRIKFSYKFYFNDDSNITWGPLAGTDTEIDDYDLLNIDYSETFDIGFQHFPELTFGVEYVIGREGFDTDSVDINLIIPWEMDGKGWQIPFLIRAHIGPMDRLSDYTQSRNSIGFGVAFSY